MAYIISAQLRICKQPGFRESRFPLKQPLLEAAIFFILKYNLIRTKVIAFSGSKSKIKVMVQWTSFFILLTSAIIQHFKFLYEKEVDKYILHRNCHRLRGFHFIKLLQSSTKES